MARIDDVCPGNCATCGLLQAGRVEMVPCLLDQVFQTLKRQGKEIAELKELVNEIPQEVATEVNLAALDESAEEEKEDKK
jgi:hypothetical protein